MPAAGPGRGRVRRLSSPAEAEEGILHHALGGRLVAQHEYREPDEAMRVRLVQRRHLLPGRVRDGGRAAPSVVPPIKDAPAAGRLPLGGDDEGGGGDHGGGGQHPQQGRAGPGGRGRDHREAGPKREQAGADG
jgi:hypothetical protein